MLSRGAEKNNFIVVSLTRLGSYLWTTGLETSTLTITHWCGFSTNNITVILLKVVVNTGNTVTTLFSYKICLLFIYYENIIQFLKSWQLYMPYFQSLKSIHKMNENLCWHLAIVILYCNTIIIRIKTSIVQGMLSVKI